MGRRNVYPSVAAVGHNLGFDLAFLARLGFRSGRVRDTMLLSQVLHAAGYTKGIAPTKHGLKDCAAREMAVTLDKDLQKADWWGRLSSDQLAYAAADVRGARTAARRPDPETGPERPGPCR